MEFERKFKFGNKPPEWEGLERVEERKITQYYLGRQDCLDLRVRVSNYGPHDPRLTQYVLTLKSSHTGVAREEHNIRLDVKEGMKLCNSSMVKSFISKTRTTWRSPKRDDIKIDIDVFDKDLRIKDPATGEFLEGLIEVEFMDRNSAERFIPYISMGDEVTSDGRYRNINLAKQI